MIGVERSENESVDLMLLCVAVYLRNPFFSFSFYTLPNLLSHHWHIEQMSFGLTMRLWKPIPFFSLFC